MNYYPGNGIRWGGGRGSYYVVINFASYERC